MTTHQEEFTIGVEEEFLLLDPATLNLRPSADRALAAARDRVGEDVQHEFRLSQLETVTPVCQSLTDLRRELVRLRREVATAAEEAGCRIGAVGTHPFSHWSDDRITPNDVYCAMEEEYQQLAREHVVCACHVHVGVSDPEEVIVAMNGVRLWLAPLLALSANSPFWLGADTGYASYRTEIARRSPLAGVPPAFDSRAHYDELVGILMTAAKLDSPGRIRWDVRPSARYPTLEFRVTDACLSVDETIMVAGLARAMTRACIERVKGRSGFHRPPRELLRVAMWNAARYGLDGDLVDVVTRRPVPAHEVIGALLDFVRPVLEDSSEWEEISVLVTETERRGTGAARQRQAFQKGQRLEDVVGLIVAETART